MFEKVVTLETSLGDEIKWRFKALKHLVTIQYVRAICTSNFTRMITLTVVHNNANNANANATIRYNLGNHEEMVKRYNELLQYISNSAVSFASQGSAGEGGGGGWGRDEG